MSKETATCVRCSQPGRKKLIGHVALLGVDSVSLRFMLSV
jgi:hypothetical protein